MKPRFITLLLFFAMLLIGFPHSHAAVSTASPAAPPSQSQAAQADLPVRMVVLFSSGVGYFEHAGTVSGNAGAELRFKSDQINDMLKSLVLEDLDGGKVGAVVYPSLDPLSKTLQSFQVDITSNPSLADVLNQLRGAQVRVTAQAEQIEGAVLGMEKRPKALVGKDNEAVEAWVLNVLSGAVVRSVFLDEIRTIEMLDPQLEEELHKALLAVSQARNQDKKPVAVSFEGNGDRRVRLRYVVEAPVWKTSYRLILPARPEDAPKLQGWAIVENQTDNDWSDVRLSLVSGRPISFIEDLYQPLYVPRPVVEPELYSSLKPQTYEAGINDSARKKSAQKEDKAEMLTARPAPQAAPPPGAPMARSLAGAGAAPEQETPFDPTASVVAAASAGKLGELFQYTIDKVSLPRQRSAMIPILTDSIDVERVSIYNRSTLPQNPLYGAILKNTTGKHLLQGPVTVFDGAGYAGDAQIGSLPPGQDRLLSYGIDLDLQMDASKQRQENAILTGRIVKGVLEVSRKRVSYQEYIAQSKSDKEKTLIIEHLLKQGWKLVDTPEPVETTGTLYRFKAKAPAGEKLNFTVKEEIVQGETIAILPADLGQIDFYSRSGEIPKDVRNVLVKAMEFKRAMIDTERQINDRQSKVDEITREQERIRANLGAVGSNTQYSSRLLAKLNEQETAIEKLQAEIEKLRKTYETQRADLEAYLVSTSAG
jgi:hypothetical protein